MSAINFNFGGKSALRHSSKRAKHLPSLVVVSVNGLLAQDNELRRFLLDYCLE